MSLLDKLKIKKEDWLYYGEWQQPPLSAQFWTHYYQKDITKKMKLPSFNGGLIMIGGYTLIFKNDFEKLKKVIKEALRIKDHTFFKNYLNISLSVLNDFIQLKDEVSNDDGIKLFKKFISESRKIYHIWWLSVLFSDYFGELLISEAEKFGISATKVISYIQEKETLIIKQLREAKKIQDILKRNNLLNASEEELKQNIEVWKVIETHLEEFDWIGTHHLWGEGLSLKKLLEKVNDMKEEKKNVEKPPEDISFVTEIAGQLSYLRTYTPETFNSVAFKMIPLMTNLAKELGLNYEEFLLLTPDEIFKYFDKSTRPSKNNLDDRKKGFIVLMKGEKEIVIDNQQEIEIFINKLLPKTNVDITELKGQVANKGYAKGVVKVFLVPENMKNMKNGDVLITPMTTPDFVPLMKKASAIITDMGGLLSHAAIISRELNKPCIVGTKLATQVFKDGDLVEVDADSGVIKKL